jgi:6-pyruvoyltetrahydropterin/6-carboxytetrahydropterin synthase
MFELTHRIEFAAAHRLSSPHLSEDENRALYGPCWRLHGHNYVLETSVAGRADPRTGMVMDFNVLAKIVEQQVFADVDHRNLQEDVPWLEGKITTAEVFAEAIWERLAEPLEGRLYRLRLHESSAAYVDYYGPEGRPAAG